MQVTSLEGARECSCAIVPAREIAGLEQVWTDLQMRSEHSFFLSWGWIGTWLAELPSTVDPLCLMVRYRGTLAGLGIFVAGSSRRLWPAGVQTLHLHQTGKEALDRITIEYNGLLIAKDSPSWLPHAAIDYLASLQQWEEIHFGGVGQEWTERLRTSGMMLLERQSSPSYHVALHHAVTSEQLWHPSPQTAYQIRRSLRLYGDVEVAVPGTRAHAEAVWCELKRLHQDRWTRRCQPGAFADGFQSAFHERLIATRWSAGEIQLLRTHGGRGTIGCLYNFMYRGRVYSYQGGFTFESDNRLKPGLVTHTKAIELNGRLGMKEYDFLAGDARYKRSLANGRRNLHWLVLQRPKVKFAVEAAAKRLRRNVRSLLTRRQDPGR